MKRNLNNPSLKAGSLRLAEWSDRLTSILQNELLTIRNLADLSGRQTAAIVQNDLSKVNRIVEQQADSNQRLANLEEERSKVTMQMAAYLGVQPENASLLRLREIEEMLFEPNRRRLSSIRKELSRLVERIQHTNALNSILIGNMLGMINQTVQEIVRLATSPPGYGGRPSAQGATFYLDTKA